MEQSFSLSFIVSQPRKLENGKKKSSGPDVRFSIFYPISVFHSHSSSSRFYIKYFQLNWITDQALDHCSNLLHAANPRRFVHLRAPFGGTVVRLACTMSMPTSTPTYEPTISPTTPTSAPRFDTCSLSLWPYPNHSMVFGIITGVGEGVMWFQRLLLPSSSPSPSLQSVERVRSCGV
jgi:hypothetical protein